MNDFINFFLGVTFSVSAVLYLIGGLIASGLWDWIGGKIASYRKRRQERHLIKQNQALGRDGKPYNLPIK